MKPYMGFSRAAGSGQGAILCFAFNILQARRILYPELFRLKMLDEYTDMAVKWVQGKPFLMEKANKELLDKDIPHILKNPKACNLCNAWGMELDRDGLCEECNETRLA